MNAWQQMLMQPALERTLWREVAATVLLLVGAALSLAVEWMGYFPPGLGALLAITLSCATAVMWWALFMQSATRQNTPAAACLVPFLQRRLMTLSALVWLACSAAPALLFGVPAGHAGYTLLLCAWAQLFVTVGQRHAVVSLLPSVALLLLAFSGLTPPVLASMLAAVDETHVTLAGMALLLPLAFFALRLLLPRGGEGHYDWGARTAARAHNRKGGMAHMGYYSRGGPLDMIYRARLGSAARPAERLLDGLGPGAHWSRPALAVFFATATAMIASSGAGEATLRAFVPLLSASLLVPLGLYVKSLATAIRDGAAEEGILRLTPMAPPLRSFNRDLAVALLGRFGIAWAAYLACSAVAFALTTHSWSAWLLGAALTATLAPVLLGDHARESGWRSSTMVVGAAMLALPALLGMLDHGMISPALVAAIVVVLLAWTLISLRRRWTRMLAAAPAFPAGRLASS